MKHLSFFIVFIICPLFANSQSYTFPDETEIHEGTWLQWPHQYEYGISYRNSLDATWVAMTNALQFNEKVHIIAYNTTEQNRIISLLNNLSVPLTNVDFKIFQTNDVWVRDNGPIYVRNSNNQLLIQDWGFNGWGGDYGFAKCNVIPTSIANATASTILNLNTIMTVEGGAWEMDGNGVFLATKSAVLSQSNQSSQIHSVRNLGMTEAQANAVFTQYLGANKLIWLNGFFSLDDITDAHIDGFAKFAPTNKLVTMSQTDLLYWGLSQADINTLFAASNTNNVVYTKVYLPLTQNDVATTSGTNLGYKGSYVNYYVANNRVLVPNYNDQNDAIANAIIQNLYPSRTVVGIDVRNLYANGGMVHCITQQQPAATLLKIDQNDPNNNKTFLIPNPAKTHIQIQSLDDIKQIEIFDEMGHKIYLEGTKNQKINIESLSKGIYFVKIYFDKSKNTILKFIKE
jgi:agmatine deiminase